VVAAALVAVFFGTTTSGSAAVAQSSISAGVGNALAQTEVVGPSFANLSLALTFGRSIAGHQNTVAQASSQAIDLGEIGATLAGEGCDGSDPTLPANQQPQAARVDSRDQNPTIDEDETFVPGVPMHKRAEATPAPFGEAVTTIAPMGVAGVLEIGAATATTYSGILNGDTREAKAVVDISGIRVAGAAGLVDLSGLHWEASWRSTGDGAVTGLFSIASAKIAGVPLPTSDPAQVLDQLNTILAPVGIRLVPPQAHQSGGVLFVDPLGIDVVPSATRDAIVGTLLNSVQPIRQAVVDALAKQSCTNFTYITIADLVLGSVTGAGAFKIDLGGVQATSGEVPTSTYSLGGQQLVTNGAAAAPSVVSSAPSSKSGTSGTASASSPQSRPTASTVSSGTKPLTSTTPAATRGSAMTAVGLVGLGLVALMAEGDRRKMRRAQREIPDFEV
jgi:hypothetical protein